MTQSPRRLYFGGELHNSSASSLPALREAFHTVASIGADTVLAPISWEIVEPREGEFDLSLVEAALQTADAEGLFWVPLWFGAWKNGASTYVPSWVKRDVARFPRAWLASGPIEHISPMDKGFAEADATAFARVMACIRDSRFVDRVPFVQVENEPGLLGGRRDLSDAAKVRWQENVPEPVVTAVRTSSGRLRDTWEAQGAPNEGGWRELFGAEADQAFMASAYATHVEHVAARGRAELRVPLFVNAWLDAANPTVPADQLVSGGAEPGSYPSGGPISHLLPIWRALAPSIAFFSPDIYFGDFDRTCRSYAAASDRLVIPEMRRDQLGVAHMFRAVGKHQAELVAPFGLDSLHPGAPDYEEIVDAYALLSAMRSTIAGSARESVSGFMLDRSHPVERVNIGGVQFDVSLTDPHGLLEDGEIGYGIAVEIGGSLRVAGRGFTLQPAQSENGHVGLASVTEQNLDLKVHRVLNGDEVSGATVRFHRLYSGRGQGVVPFDTRCTGIADIEFYLLK